MRITRLGAVRTAVALASASALAVTGCGKEEPKLTPACVEGASVVRQALQTAPGQVRLPDGTRLSQCVSRALGDGEIQDLGLNFTRVADRLAAEAARDDAAALQLGFLVGATQRGAGRTNGIHLELVRRMEQVVGVDGMAGRAGRAYDRGLAAGARSG